MASTPSRRRMRAESTRIPTHDDGGDLERANTAFLDELEAEEVEGPIADDNGSESGGNSNDMVSLMDGKLQKKRVQGGRRHRRSCKQTFLLCLAIGAVSLMSYWYLFAEPAAEELGVDEKHHSKKSNNSFGGIANKLNNSKKNKNTDLETIHQPIHTINGNKDGGDNKPKWTLSPQQNKHHNGHWGWKGEGNHLGDEREYVDEEGNPLVSPEVAGVAAAKERGEAPPAEKSWEKKWKSPEGGSSWVHNNDANVVEVEDAHFEKPAPAKYYPTVDNPTHEYYGDANVVEVEDAHFEKPAPAKYTAANVVEVEDAHFEKPAPAKYYPTVDNPTHEYYGDDEEEGDDYSVDESEEDADDYYDSGSDEEEESTSTSEDGSDDGEEDEYYDSQEETDESSSEDEERSPYLDLDLDTVWVQYEDQNGGQPYFYRHSTQETTYEVPPPDERTGGPGYLTEKQFAKALEARQEEDQRIKEQEIADAVAAAQESNPFVPTEECPTDYTDGTNSWELVLREFGEIESTDRCDADYMERHPDEHCTCLRPTAITYPTSPTRWIKVGYQAAFDRNAALIEQEINRKSKFDVIMFGDDEIEQFMGTEMGVPSIDWGPHEKVYQDIFNSTSSPVKGLALGIRDDRGQNLLYQVHQPETIGNELLQAPVWWISAGTNDLFLDHCSFDMAAAGTIKAVQDLLQAKPNAKIVLQSLLPHGLAGPNIRNKHAITPPEDLMTMTGGRKRRRNLRALQEETPPHEGEGGYSNIHDALGIHPGRDENLNPNGETFSEKHLKQIYEDQRRQEEENNGEAPETYQFSNLNTENYDNPFHGDGDGSLNEEFEAEAKKHKIKISKEKRKEIKEKARTFEQQPGFAPMIPSRAEYEQKVGQNGANDEDTAVVPASKKDDGDKKEHKKKKSKNAFPTPSTSGYKKEGPSRPPPPKAKHNDLASDNRWKRISAINERLACFAASTDRVEFYNATDIVTKTVKDNLTGNKIVVVDESLMLDSKHLNVEGVRKLGEAIAEKVQEILNR